MRIRKALTALIMAVLALVVAPSAANAAGGAANGGRADLSAPFSAQARSAGLSAPQAKSLQNRVDGYLARTHGRQTGVNKIALDNGVLLLALPGERRARDLAVPNAPSGAEVNCAYTYVCAYSGEDFTGDEMILFTCNHLNRIYWSGTGSWINNQRSTLYAKFYGSNGVLGWTSPGGYSEDRHAPWGWVYWLSPC